MKPLIIIHGDQMTLFTSRISACLKDESDSQCSRSRFAQFEKWEPSMEWITSSKWLFWKQV